MIEGELYQLTKTGDVDITVDEHFDIIRRKTAHLFGGCAQIGGMLGATTPEQQAALWEYGFNLGIAFQVVDDLLDYTADERALGKPIGSDLREGKVTLPIIYLLERGGEARDIVDGIVRDRDVTREQLGRAEAACWRHAVDRQGPPPGRALRRAWRCSISPRSRPRRRRTRCWPCRSTSSRATASSVASGPRVRGRVQARLC